MSRRAGQPVRAGTAAARRRLWSLPAWLSLPIMGPASPKRYPMLKTYLGQGIDNPTATVRFDLTVRGFRAQVIATRTPPTSSRTRPATSALYVVFNKSDYRKQGAAFTCGVTGEEIKSVPQPAAQEQRGEHLVGRQPAHLSSGAGGDRRIHRRARRHGARRPSAVRSPP